MADSVGVLRQLIGAPEGFHTHASHVACYPACQAYNLIDALAESLRDGNAILAQHSRGGDAERIKLLDAWLDAHGAIVDSIVATREVLSSVAEEKAAEGDEAARVGSWIRANGGYFGMSEDDANAMAAAYADSERALPGDSGRERGDVYMRARHDPAATHCLCGARVRDIAEGVDDGD